MTTTTKHLQVLLSGEFISEKVRKNLKLLILVAVLCVTYIAYGYHSQLQIKEANRLHKQVEDARYEQLVWSCKYAQYTRMAHVNTVLGRHGRDLHISTTPPVRL